MLGSATQSDEVFERGLFFPDGGVSLCGNPGHGSAIDDSAQDSKCTGKPACFIAYKRKCKNFFVIDSPELLLLMDDHRLDCRDDLGNVW
jgi:hypothetical protein